MAGYNDDFVFPALRPFSKTNDRYTGSGQNQLAQAGQDALSSIGKIMQQKKADKIANALIHSQVTGQPYTPALSQQNVPDYGGASALQAYQQSLQFKNDAADRTQKTNLVNAQIQHYLRPQVTEGSYVDTPYGRMTAHEWADVQAKQQNTSPIGKLNNKLMTQYGLTSDDVDMAAKSGTPYVQVDADGVDQPISTQDAQKAIVQKQPVFAVVNSSGAFPTKVPLKDWGQIMQLNQNLRATGQSPIQTGSSLYQQAIGGSGYPKARPALPDTNDPYADANNSAPLPQADSSAPSQAPASTPTIASEDDYNALPSGSTYIDSRDGKTKRKK